MKQENFDKVIDLLEKTGMDIDFRYHLKDEDFETADDIRDILEDANAFDTEIIYYARAMEFLTQNDTSLCRSLAIAGSMGYKPEDLNSEILASLLSSEITREEFQDVSNKLDELLEAIREEEEDEEENEDEI